MKNERLLSNMNLLDDKYIDEANPENKNRKKKINWLRFGLIAACICLMVTAMNLYLFIPFTSTVPDVSEYENNEYYPIIEKLNALSVVKPKYKNNFDKIISSLSAVFDALASTGVDFDAIAPGDSPVYGASPDGSNEENENGSYKEITDNQVDGVIEGDLIKRSDKYIYYLSESKLNVYSINGTDSKLVGELDLSNIQYKNSYGKTEELDVSASFGYSCEMYLSQDCNTVNIIGPYTFGGIDCTTGKGNIKSGTVVISLDVRDATNIFLKNYVLIEGSYSTSRLANGKLLVITKKTYDTVDYSKAESFVPGICYDNGTKTELIPMSNIACPDIINTKNYTVVSLLDESTLELSDCAGFLSYSDEVYVTNNAIYATNRLREDISDTVSTKSKTVTEIACIAYGDSGFDVKGSVKVDGYIKDRYSLDEYDSILRVVTTTESFIRKYYSFSGNESFSLDTAEGTSASLYCIDLSSWSVVSSVEKFAPSGETVRSVRFDKDYCYVCTAVQLTDPVFFFDLSDINNITYKDTGNIEGFSTSLINLGNGYLLGIGRGDDWNTIKIEVYTEGENAITSVCSYEIENAYYSTDYKSYYVDRKNQLFGFGCTEYDYSNSSKYILLLFSNGELIELVNTELKGNNAEKRAVYIDGHIYLLGSNDFKVIKIL